MIAFAPHSATFDLYQTATVCGPFRRHIVLKDMPVCASEIFVGDVEVVLKMKVDLDEICQRLDELRFIDR
jgi:hypothetical protein